MQVGPPSKWYQKPHKLHPRITPDSIAAFGHFSSRVKDIAEHSKSKDSVFKNENIMKKYNGKKINLKQAGINNMQRESTELLKHINEIQKQYAQNPNKNPYISPELQIRIIGGLNEKNKFNTNKNINTLSSLEKDIYKRKQNRANAEIRKEVNEVNEMKNQKRIKEIRNEIASIEAIERQFINAELYLPGEEGAGAEEGADD